MSKQEETPTYALPYEGEPKKPYFDKEYIESKINAFSEAHKGETAEQIEAACRGEEVPIEVCGKKVVVRYVNRKEYCCKKCCFVSGDYCLGITNASVPCDDFYGDGKRAYFVEAETEETNSLREWAQIFATNPDLRAEFDKMCPPQPIQGSIAPEADLEAEVDKYLVENYTDDTEVDTPFLERMFSHDRNDLVQFARHFAGWERKRTLDKVVEWMKANLTYMHPRKGVETCMVNIPAFLDAMNE